MRKLFIVCLFLSVLGTSKMYGQINMELLNGETDVTITMDLQPVLELSMTTPDQIDFVFDNINAYMAGITRYGATVLKVSSTVDWDLAAVGTSGRLEVGGVIGTAMWDNPVQYSANGSVDIPLECLELQQIPANPSTCVSCVLAGVGTGNYNGAFAQYNGLGMQASYNAIEVSAQAAAGTVTFLNSGVLFDRKMIAGEYGVATAAFGDGISSVPPGSWLNTEGSNYDAYMYKYTISYRIVPALPAIFPMRDDETDAAPNGITGAAGAQAFARPGVYTMEVRYILTEDQ